jgi:hypothetical protein
MLMDRVTAFLLDEDFKAGRIPYEDLKVRYSYICYCDQCAYLLYALILFDKRLLYRSFVNVSMKATDGKILAREIKIRAIEEELGILSDGTFKPLTIRQRI